MMAPVEFYLVSNCDDSLLRSMISPACYVLICWTTLAST